MQFLLVYNKYTQWKFLFMLIILGLTDLMFISLLVFVEDRAVDKNALFRPPFNVYIFKKTTENYCRQWQAKYPCLLFIYWLIG